VSRNGAGGVFLLRLNAARLSSQLVCTNGALEAFKTISALDMPDEISLNQRPVVLIRVILCLQLNGRLIRLSYTDK